MYRNSSKSTLNLRRKDAIVVAIGTPDDVKLVFWYRIRMNYYLELIAQLVFLYRIGVNYVLFFGDNILSYVTSVRPRKQSIIGTEAMCQFEVTLVQGDKPTHSLGSPVNGVSWHETACEMAS